MLTRFVLSSVIHGCSSIFHGIPRRLGFFSRLVEAGQLRARFDSKKMTYQLSMKCLKLSLQKMPASGSSFSLGMGC